MSDGLLTIERASYKRAELVTVSGRVDSQNAQDFDDALKEIIAGGQHHIVINLSGISYMSSAGLRTLVSALRACRSHRGDVLISDPSERMVEVLELSGLSTGAKPLFAIYEDDTAAVGSF